MIQININKNFSKTDNLILLAEASCNFGLYGLTDAEIEYVQTQIKAKATNIIINKLDYHIFIQIADTACALNKEKENLRRGACKIHDLIVGQKIRSITLTDTGVSSQLVYAFAEGLILSDYQFLKYVGKKDDKRHSLTELFGAGPAFEQSDVDTLNGLMAAVYKARDMINEPANYMTATQLAEEIQTMGREAGFEVQVFRKAEIQDMKMGGILAVNKGSTEAPTFSVMEWKPENARNQRPVVLVGKGIVYDTGGHSLKPTDNSMDYMKCDMAGGAVVAAVLYAVAKSALPLHVVGLVPATDNRLSAESYSPGDIITMYDGTTVEGLDTDAEGRIVLADALSYAKKFNPELVIDIATLTGAAHRAIGELGMAGMGNVSREIAERIKNCGDSVFERVAELPFWEEYAEKLKSDIADLNNTGGDLAGAIVAGKFLEHFTDYPYFHLDIAGLAFLKKPDGYRVKGGTGTGVRLLFEFLKNYQ